MAITKLLNIKADSRGSSGHLANSIKYILNPEKTQGGLMVGGNAGTEYEEVYQAMTDTKDAWGKRDGRQGYHFVLSWKPGEIDTGMAYQVMKEFCEEYLGENYDFVFAVHDDQEHAHGHIVFNSVNRVNGYKYRYERGDWEKYIQPVTDKICEKYNLKKLEYDRENRKGCSYAQHMAEKEGRKNWKQIIRADIDYAVSDSETYDAFKQNMERMGYTVKEGYSRKKGRGQLSFLAPGQKRAWRDDKLGENYKLENIKKRLGAEKRFFHMEKSPRIKKSFFRARPLKKPYRSLSRYQARHVRKWHKTRNWLKNPYAVDQREIRRNLLQINRLHEDCCYLIRNGIRNEKDLQQRENMLKNLEQEMKDFRQGYYLLHTDEAYLEYQDLKKELLKVPENDDRFEEILDRMDVLEEKLPEPAGAVSEQFKKVNDELASLRKEKRIIRHIKREGPDMYVIPLKKPANKKTAGRSEDQIWMKR